MIRRTTNKKKPPGYTVCVGGQYLPGTYASPHAAEFAKAFCTCTLESLSRRGVIGLAELRDVARVTCISCKRAAVK